MEQRLEIVLNDINSQPETSGCLITNRQGLCLGANGKINQKMSGIGMALSEQACKIEPNLNPPTIVLYSGNKIGLWDKANCDKVTFITASCF